MKQIVTPAIVLSRMNYGEADRILHVITPKQGKISILAKGVRRVKSKLAGGIELFSVNTITYIDGRSELKTLTSSRVEQHFGNIVHDITRTMFAYDALKLIHKVTEDAAEGEYFDMLSSLLVALNDPQSIVDALRVWLYIQLLATEGHVPNLRSDSAGKKLQEQTNYVFSFEDMAFTANSTGNFTDKHIKLLRLMLAIKEPQKLAQVQDLAVYVQALLPLTKTMAQTHIRL